MNDIICTTNYAEIFDGPFYEPCPQLVAKIDPHIPSDRDILAQFGHTLHRITGVTVECMKAPGSRGVCIDNHVYKRRRLYLRITLPMEVLLSQDVLPDVVRGAWLQAAGSCAGAVAPEVEALGIQSVAFRFNGTRLLNNESYEGTRRIAIDPTSDSVIAIMAVYYFVTPIGHSL